MKRKLLLSIIAILTFGFANAQDIISIVGTGVNGWPPTSTPEIDLSTTDNITYTITGLTVNTGEIKFRKNHDWGTNWGNSSANEFPTGVAEPNSSSNISTMAGTYTVTFNINTLEYSFVGAPLFFEIGIWGPAVDPVNGYQGPDVDLSTTDGVNYILSAYNFTSGPAKFVQNDDPLVNWGDVDFPVGTAYPDGPAILVEGGLYTLRFNRTTGDYSFLHPSVGILGTAVNGWDTDVDMMTSDGNTYTLMGQMINAGVLKFRQDDMWTVSWGGDTFPAGPVTGNDIPVTAEQAGMYNITFNRAEQTYTFTPSLGVNSSVLGSLKIYPNPSNNVWNIETTSAITKINVSDISGKVVFTAQPNGNAAAINAAEFQSGIYFAQIATASGTQTVKLIRK
jgi:hypothetical protein